VSRGRRSQEFHDLVEDVEDTAGGGARRSSYDDLLDVVGALRAVPEPVPDPTFVASLRERLLEEATTVLVAAVSMSARVIVTLACSIAAWSRTWSSL
jgi:hypothetical protein